MDDIMKDPDSGSEMKNSASMAEWKVELSFDLGVDYAALFQAQTGKDFETGEFVVQ